jgi:hypothetical protein
MSASRSLEEVARSLRLSREDPIERALSGEIDNLREYLGSLPWTLPSARRRRLLRRSRRKPSPSYGVWGSWYGRTRRRSTLLLWERLLNAWLWHLADPLTLIRGHPSEASGSTPSSSRCTTLAYWPTSTVGQTIFGFSSRYNFLQEQMTKTLPLFFPGLGIASIPTRTNFLRDSIPNGASH